ncbi:hypothetical protein LUZ63_015488 [Rhynchospora breviuscula]|uniref:RWP-RK domain-containing protein n=1 Tax=Rhynchospora breviuscula TaxID=2022672 RepID=A0A9Q0HMQ0_9POAL|nr:hypothetical protein LUZ63_015488 [Rhynchospora breviuscula]
MDPSDEQYDPDGDVSRFLSSPDPHEGSPMISLPPSLPPDALQPTLPLRPQEVLQSAPSPLFSQEALQQTAPLLPQEALQQVPPLLPHEVLHLALPVLPQDGFQQAPPLLPHQEVLQRNQVFDGTNAVPATANMETQVAEPLSVEGVIIAAMEGIQIEGSSSTNPVNDALYEPVFLHHAPEERDCTGCVPLREVTHSSPNRNLIFSIHGGIGTFDHAIFDVEYFQRDGRPSIWESFYVDLSMRSHNWVKSFILGCVTLLQSDLTGTTQDSLTSFYDTLCADMSFSTVDEAMSVDLGTWLQFQDLPDFEVGESSRAGGNVFEDSDPNFNLPIMPDPTTAAMPNPTESQIPMFGSVSPAMPEAGSSSGTANVIPEAQQATPVEPSETGTGRRSTGTQLALQRQRTANMRLPELANYLHLPIAEASRRLGLCSTALKHVCRRNGLGRWPSRQIQAIDRQIAKLEREAVKGGKKSGMLAIKEEIEALQMKKMVIYEKLFRDANDNDGANS